MRTKTLQKILFLVAMLIICMGVYADDSAYCKSLIGGAGSFRAYLTWETNEYGDVDITISGYDGDMVASYRGSGLKPLTGFKVNEQPMTDYFTAVYRGDKSTVFTLQLKEDAVVPEDAVITFNGTGEWRTALTNNAYDEFMKFTYVYGTTCPKLDTPTITEIAGDGTLFFNPVENATKYLVVVSKDGTQLHSQFVTEPGERISFISYLNVAYSVKIQATTSAGYLDSNFSEAATWNAEAVPLGDSECCNAILGTTANNRAYLSWQTDEDGKIIIAIYGADGTAASFRGNNGGMNPIGFKYDGKPMSDYFSVAHVVGSSTIVYTPKEDAEVEYGATVTFNKFGESQNIEWKTEKDNNAYTPTLSYSYTYGTSCNQLDAPVITSIDTDGVIDFDEVTGAKNYKVYVYRDDLLVYSQSLNESGEKINYVSYIAGDDCTYTVKMQAMANLQTANLNSDLLEGKSWTPEIDVLPGSVYCNYRIGGTTTYANLTWITNAEGNVVISISGYEEKTASFRGNNMPDAGFKVLGKPLADFFTKELKDNNTIVLKLKAGAAIKPGDKITFNKAAENQSMQWYSGVTEGSGTTSFEYIYGTSCDELDIPVIISIAADGTIVFDEVDNAGGYKIYVYNENGNLVHLQNIESGETIDFFSYEEATFSVVLQALAVVGSGGADSELSEPKEWTPTVTALGGSEYCSEPIKAMYMDYSAYLSWETNEDGEVVITISGYEGADASFSGENGMVAEGFRIYGEPLTDYFNVIYGGDRTKTITLSPKMNVKIDKGTKIIFSGVVSWWFSPTQSTSASLSFSYSYGTVCEQEQLATPQITNIAADGTITFNEVDNADSYAIYVYRGSIPLHNQIIENNGKINYTPKISTTYSVFIKALSADQSLFLDSELSASYSWNYTTDPIVLGKSEYCDYEFKAIAGVYANITWITDEDGNIEITLSDHGEETNTAFRLEGMNISSFTMYGFPLSTYFTKEYEVGSTTIRLTPNNHNTVFPGDKIKFSGNVEWASSSESNAWGAFSFEYTYGTVCEDVVVKVPLATPVISGITKDGTITFDAVNNADSYMVYIYDEDMDEIHTQAITPGGRITSPSIANYVYSVYLKAFPVGGDENYVASALSAAYEWDRTETSQPEKLATPVISAISNDSILTFNAIAHADSYVVYVYKDGAEVYQQTIASGEKINFTSDIEYTYTVKLKAVPATGSTAYLESDLSVEYEWILKGTGTGIYDLEAETISFYPNPVTDVLYFTTEVSQASLYSLQGQLILNYKHVESIDVVNYPKGMYILQVTDSQGNKVTHKVEIR